MSSSRASHRSNSSWTLRTLLAGFADVLPSDDVTVTGLSMDSRNLSEGALFLAVQGITSHGLCYVERALDQGGSAVAYEPAVGIEPYLLSQEKPFVAVEALAEKAGYIAARFYGEPSRKLFVVGITGTNGKTSVAYFLAQIMPAAGFKSGVMGTLGCGMLGSLETASHTTADAVSVQAELAKLKQQEVQGVAMEVSSHALTQGRVNGVEFDAAVFTNLSRDHLDYHGDMESYAKAKRALLASPGLKVAVVNIDDTEGRRWQKVAPDGVKLVAYSVANETADVFLSVVELTQNGFSGRLHWQGESAAFSAALMGRFNLSNLLACAAVMLANNTSLGQVAKSLKGVAPAPGRMQLIETSSAQPSVVVDFAHTPDALDKALSALKEHCCGELFCVFGCGGDRDAGKRPMMAAVSERLAGKVFVTDDNPRTESAAAIVAQIMDGFANRESVTLIHDRKKAIAAAISLAGAGDCVLIAGKGHETYQLIGHKKHPFNDVEVAVSCLREVNA